MFVFCVTFVVSRLFLRRAYCSMMLATGRRIFVFLEFKYSVLVIGRASLLDVPFMRSVEKLAMSNMLFLCCLDFSP